MASDPHRPSGPAAAGPARAAGGFQVRAARRSDLPGVARFAAELVRLHHRWDPRRFMLPEPLEEGYRWWLGKELDNAAAVVLVAEVVPPASAPAAGHGGDASGGDAAALLGYAYGRLEERDWNALLDACGAIHDLYVDPGARRGGVARALIEGLLAALEQRGAPRVVLGTAWQNAEAQALFRALGFRPTMIEMTRERGGLSG